MAYKDENKKREYQREYRQKNKEKIKKQKQEYYQKNKDKTKERRKEYMKEYREKNKERVKKYSKEYRLKNKEKIKEKRDKKKDRRKEYVKEYLARDGVMIKVKKHKQEHYQKNKDKINRYQKSWREKNPIVVRLKNLLNRALKTYTKAGKTKSSKKYGIDYQAIIEYLKPLPENLSNYHLHHIKPLFTFNFNNEDGSTNLEEIKKAFAPENHKLLTIEEHKKIHKTLNCGNQNYKKTSEDTVLI